MLSGRAAERALRELLRNWAQVPDDARIERLDGGYLNDVFEVAGAGQRWVLRVCVAETSRASVEWEHRLLTALGDPRAPAPIPTERDATIGVLAAGGRTRSSWLSLFVEGALVDPSRAEHRIAAASALGALHGELGSLTLGPRPQRPALVDLDWRENEWWSWSQGAELALGTERMDALDAAITASVQGLARLAQERWPRQPLHGDYYAGNLRIDGGRIVGVFDWDEARLDWRVCDVADALWSFCANGDRTNLDDVAAAASLAAYEAAAGWPLLDSERQGLRALIRIRRTWEALAGLGEAQRGRSFDLAYFDTNLATIAALPDG